MIITCIININRCQILDAFVKKGESIHENIYDAPGSFGQHGQVGHYIKMTLTVFIRDLTAS